jgi:hypothetical protein
MPVEASASITIRLSCAVTPMREKLFHATKLSCGSGRPFAECTSMKLALKLTTISVTSISDTSTDAARRRSDPA